MLKDLENLELEPNTIKSLEDLESIRAKVGLVKKYNLAGVASWAKDREDERVWGVIKEELNK